MVVGLGEDQNGDGEGVELDEVTGDSILAGWAIPSELVDSQNRASSGIGNVDGGSRVVPVQSSSHQHNRDACIHIYKHVLVDKKNFV